MDNKTDTSSKEAKKENSAVEGLKHNFAQEQADGQDKRMMAYIEKEVAKKYHGETEENQSQPGEVSLPPQWEQIRRLRSQLGVSLFCILSI